MLTDQPPRMPPSPTNRYWLRVAASAAWLGFCGYYISVYCGWGNLFKLMPNEFFLILFAAILPFGIYFIVKAIIRIAAGVETLNDEVGVLAHRDTGMADAMRQLSQAITDSQHGATAQVEAQVRAMALLAEATRDSRQDIIGELRVQGNQSREVARELSHVLQSRAVSPPADSTPSIDRMHSLAEVLTLALNDLSMTATQLLVDLLEATDDDKEGHRKLVGLLTDAYFAGDKNVFFRSLAHEVASRSEPLRARAEDSEAVRRRISKILREAAEINSLVTQCDQNDLIRIVFEDGELWTLEKVLAQHFQRDGSVQPSS